LATTEDATKVLEEQIRNFSLKTIEGENVKKAKQLLLSGIHRLEQVNQLPTDIVLVLIKVFQTSSVEEFNNMFAHLESRRDIEQIFFKGGNKYVSPQYHYRVIILLAVNKHHIRYTKGTWTGTNTAGTDSSFVARQAWSRRPPVCWNCGGPHTLYDFRKEGDARRISGGEQNFNEQRELRKRGTGAADQSNVGVADRENGGDWKSIPPAQGESRKQERDGKHYFFMSRARKWTLDRDFHPRQPSPPGNPAAAVVEPGPPSSPPPAPAVAAMT
jgi:hypothetical protein